MNNFNHDNIPLDLRECPQWVAWDAEDRGADKPAKIPYSPATGNRASSTNPNDWVGFDQAVAFASENNMAGVGFVFTVDDPYVGIDLDACLDPETGELHPEAREFVETFDTYTEISPSGTGLKMIGRGQKPDGARCKSAEVGFKEIEVYDQSRYFTVTTNVFEEHTDLRDVGDETSVLCETLLMPTPTSNACPQMPATPLTLDDNELLNRILNSQQGPAFGELWAGSLNAHGNDASSADFALACRLAFWTQKDPCQIERMMLQSGLNRPKWSTMRGDQTYLQYTIQKAIDQTDNVYDPGYISTYCVTAQPSGASDDGDYAEFHADEDGDTFSDEMQAVIRGERRPAPWPWSTLNPLTRALTPGSLTILVGSPGSSKSLMMAQAMAYWHEQNVHASCMMLEGDRNFHLRRVLAQAANNARLTNDEWVEANPQEAVAAYEEHRDLIQSLHDKIDVPTIGRPVGLQDTLDWLRRGGEDGTRILVVDPVTMIDSGSEPWVIDRHLMSHCLHVAEQNNLSIVLVTHPRSDARKPHLDYIAGGKSISRFCHNVFWLERLKHPKPVEMMGPGTQLMDEQISRVLHILKSRSGTGTGRQIGVTLNNQTLRMDLPGVILDSNPDDFTTCSDQGMQGA